MRYLAILGLIVLASCGATPVTMVNPANGKTTDCSSRKLDPILASDDVEQCVHILEAQGWQRR